jgi:hypothetical protein
MNRIEEPLACSYEDAALNHLRDGVRATVEQRWNWLRVTAAIAPKRVSGSLPAAHHRLGQAALPPGPY